MFSRVFRRIRSRKPIIGGAVTTVFCWTLFTTVDSQKKKEIKEGKEEPTPTPGRNQSWWSADGVVKPNLERYPAANQPTPKQEVANLTFAPEVPPPIDRNYPVHLKVNMDVLVKDMEIDSVHTTELWTFNGGVPGPFIRAREGDIMTVELTNNDESGMLHNIDFHSVMGPGGGAHVLTAERNQTKQATFRLEYPGLFIYHCAVAPVGVHMASGMYGAMLVEPQGGLPRVDKEFFVVQSEFYCSDESSTRQLDLDEQRGVDENPSHVVFNGRDGSLRDGGSLKANTGDRVRIYFANVGPNLVSSFHVIGAIFDKVYREGDLISPPGRGIQSTLVPSGGATVVEIDFQVPGTFAIVDHSIWRMEKGAAGWITVTGDPRPDIYHSDDPPVVCASCKHHP